MIVAMRKLSLLIYHRDYQSFLEQLREKGVVHIHENKKRTAEDEELKQKFAAIKRIGEMARVLAKRGNILCEEWEKAATPREKLAYCRELFGVEGPMPEGKVSGMDVLACLENVFARQAQIEQQVAALQKDAAVYAPWGEFPSGRIKALGEAG